MREPHHEKTSFDSSTNSSPWLDAFPDAREASVQGVSWLALPSVGDDTAPNAAPDAAPDAASGAQKKGGC